MKQLQLQYAKRLNTIIRELLAKKRAQGFLSRSETQFLNMAQSGGL